MESPDASQRGAWFSSGRVDVVIEDPPAAASLGSRAWRAFLAAATVVNFLVPMAAGIWLALHSYRLEAGVGLGCAVLVPFVWTWVAFKPSELLAAPAILAGDRAHPVVVMIASFLSAGWQYAVIAAWTLVVFLFFERRMGAGNLIPLLAWAYGVVMGPMSYMASKDPRLDSAPALALLFALCAYGTILTFHQLTIPVMTNLHWLIGLVVVAAAISSAPVTWASARQRKDGLAARQRVRTTAAGRAWHQALSMPGEPNADSD